MHHVGQEFLPGHHAAIAPAHTLNDDADDARRDSHQLLRQFLRLFHDRAGARVQVQQRWDSLDRRAAGALPYRADRAAYGEALDHLCQRVAELLFQAGAHALVDHVEGRMEQGTGFEVLHVMTLGGRGADFVVWPHGKECNIAIMPGRNTRGHADSRMHKRVGLLADAHQELAYDVRLPGKLRGIRDVLPLAAAIGQQRKFLVDALRRGSQYFEQFRACMPPAFLDHLDPYALPRNASWDEQDSPLVSTYGVSPVGQVCEFNVNAHVHLNVHEFISFLLTIVSVTSFQQSLFFPTPAMAEAV